MLVHSEYPWSTLFLSQAALMAAKQTRSERDEDLTALRVEIQVVWKEV
jgi:hypothetical protein